MFSIDLGKTWKLVHSECLPETCDKQHNSYHTVFESHAYNGYSYLQNIF